MTTTFEKAAWVLAVALFIPAILVMGGFLVAAAGAVLVLGGYYGGRYGLRIYEQQNVGKRSGWDMTGVVNGRDDDRDWGRDR